MLIIARRKIPNPFGIQNQHRICQDCRRRTKTRQKSCSNYMNEKWHIEIFCRKLAQVCYVVLQSLYLHGTRCCTQIVQIGKLLAGSVPVPATSSSDVVQPVLIRIRLSFRSGSATARLCMHFHAFLCFAKEIFIKIRRIRPLSNSVADSNPGSGIRCLFNPPPPTLLKI
jgi:hypothetical protein